MQYGTRGDLVDAIFSWIRSLVSYLILITMIENLLPDKKYEKYMRLFAGSVFLMLLLSPILEFADAKEQAAEAFSRLTLQNEARVLQREIEEADTVRIQNMMELYRTFQENDQ